MSSIDERIVRMEFDNKRFESGVNATITMLDKLNEVLKFRNGTSGFEDVQRASNSLDFSSINDHLFQVQQNFSFFGEFVRNIFDRISNKVIDLGSTMFRELTTAPLQAGFSEYELMMDSVKTIMASAGEREGKSLDDVMGYLDELNTYADKTIYSFSDMTSSIGKFTNAGVPLEDAVKAIQGISNEAALSGANAQEASRAMYNFAQALSTGFVQRIDWRSIESANMSTVEFREQLLETAAEMGTVEKTADGMYRVLSKNGQGGTMGELIDASTRFNDSLAYQWMTSDVLTKTLTKYADETTDIGKRAFKAAQEVKTFSQLIDTIKESLGSGWTKSFQYMIGDLEEATELWTAVSEEITSILDPIAQAREEMLKFWHDNGGRATAIQAISDAWQSVKTVMGSISGAFSSVFPPMTGERLVAITESIGKLASRFKDFATSSEVLFKIRGIAHGLFTVIKSLLSVIGNVLNGLKPLVDIFFDFGGIVFDAAFGLMQFVDLLLSASDPIEFLQKNFKNVSARITDVVRRLENLVKALLDFIGIHIDGNPISEMFERLAAFASSHLDFSFLNVLSEAGRGIATVFGSLGSVLSTVLNTLLGWANGGLGRIVDFFNGLWPSADKAADKTKKLSDSISALNSGKSILSAFGTVISSLVGKVSGFVKGVGESLPKVFSYLGSPEFRGVLENFATLMKGKLFMSLDGLVGKLGKAQSGGLFGNLFGGLLGDVAEKATEAIESLSEALSGLKEKGKDGSLMQTAIAIGILAGSIALLASIEPGKMTNGILGIASAMGVLIGAVKILDGIGLKNAWGMSKTAKSLIKMAIAVGILALAVRLLSGLDMESLATGLVGVGSILAMLVIATAGLSKFSGSIKKTAKGMITFAIAVGILALSVTYLSKLNWDELGRGLTGVGALLGAIAIFSRLLDRKSLSVGAALSVLIIAAAMRVLATSVKYFSAMDFDSLARGIGSVAVLLVAIGVFSRILSSGSLTIRAALTVLALAGAVKMLESTVSVFAGLQGLERGVIGVAALLGGLAILAAVVGHSSFTLTSAVNILALALAVKMLSDVVMSFSGLSWDALTVGLTGLAVSVIVMVGALAVLSSGAASMLVGAAAMGVLAIALRIFLPVLTTLAAMDIGSLVKGLVSLAAALAILGAGSLILSAIAPAIFTAAAAIGVFGIACGAFGIGINLIAVGVLALAGALAVGATSIMASAGIIYTSMITLITSVAVALAQGIITWVVTMLGGLGEILTALSVAIHAIGDFLVTNIPYVLGVIATIGISVISLLTTFVPQLVAVVTQFVVALLQTLVTWLPVLAETLVTSTVTLINSVANGIRDNSEAILGAIRNILSSIIELVLTALADIVSLIPGVGDMLAGYIMDGKDAVREALAPESFESTTSEAMDSAASGIESGGEKVSAAASQVGTEAANSFEEGASGSDGVGTAFVEKAIAEIEAASPEFAGGADSNLQAYITEFTGVDASAGAMSLVNSAADTITSNSGLFGDGAAANAEAYTSALAGADASSAGASLSSSGASGAESMRGSYESAGSNVASGFDWGIASDYALQLAREAGAKLANAALNSIKITINSKSPSKETMKLGKYTSQGFAIGISSLTNEVYKESANVGNKAIDGIRSSLGEVSKYLDEDLDWDPTIRPVMDLSEIQNGISQANGLVDNGLNTPLMGAELSYYPQSMMNAMLGSTSNSSNEIFLREIRALTAAIEGMEPSTIIDARGMMVNDRGSMSLIAEDVVNAFLRRGMM